MSDDAAQKRMNRALERLRRILARRGITSTAGVLSAVLAGTIPRDLPAATVLKIISATQISTATGAASTVLTTVVMTTKTKVAIAAAALLLAATATSVYQQQRIAALQGEVQSLHQRALVPALKRTPAVFAEERGPAHTVPAKLQDLPDSASPARSSISGPMIDKSGPHDYDTLQRGQVKEKLAALRERLSLTPEQETKIAKALAYGQMKTKIIDNDVKVFRASSEDRKKMEDAIRAALTAEQPKEYDSFRVEEKANAAEAVANRELSRLQSMTTLSPEQMDQTFAAFAEIASRESMQDLPEPGGKPEAIKVLLEVRWAARQEALGAILTPEQMANYQQAGNPFTPRGPGG